MRIPSALVLIVMASDGALAHPLGGESALGERLAHQLLGLHHLPLFFLVVVAGVIALRLLRGHRTD